MCRQNMTAVNTPPRQPVLTWPPEVLNTIAEAELQDAVVGLAKALEYLVYHTYDSRRSQPGWPDLTILGFGKCWMRELKRERGRTTLEQEAVGALLLAAGIDWAVLRPSGWAEFAEELVAAASAKGIR